MSRRATLPGADELFRRTSDTVEAEAETTAAPTATATATMSAVPELPASAEPSGETDPARTTRAPSRRRPTPSTRPRRARTTSAPSSSPSASPM